MVVQADLATWGSVGRGQGVWEVLPHAEKVEFRDSAKALQHPLAWTKPMNEMNERIYRYALGNESAPL